MIFHINNYNIYVNIYCFLIQIFAIYKDLTIPSFVLLYSTEQKYLHFCKNIL